MTRFWKVALCGCAVLSLLMVALDQYTKHLAIVGLRGRVPVEVTKWFNLKYVENPGAAWGVFSTASESFRLPFFMGVSLLAVVFIVYFYARVDRNARLMQCSLALILGGAIGNFIDRVRFNFVVDFIDWFYRNRHWPTFNIADAAISVGVALMIIAVIVEKEPDKAREPQKAG